MPQRQSADLTQARVHCVAAVRELEAAVQECNDFVLTDALKAARVALWKIDLSSDRARIPPMVWRGGAWRAHEVKWDALRPLYEMGAGPLMANPL